MNRVILRWWLNFGLRPCPGRARSGTREVAKLQQQQVDTEIAPFSRNKDAFISSVEQSYTLKRHIRDT